MDRYLRTLFYALFFILLTPFANAERVDLRGLKLGFGFDRDFGICAQYGKFNGFIGNEGLALDYLILRDKFHIPEPLYWYIAGGGFLEWKDHDKGKRREDENRHFGARLPVGVEFEFARQWDVFVQVIPDLEIIEDFEFGLDAALGVRHQF